MIDRVPATRVIRIEKRDDLSMANWFFSVAELVSELVCDVHGERAALGTIVGDVVGVSGCCDRLLDQVEAAVGKQGSTG